MSARDEVKMTVGMDEMMIIENILIQEMSPNDSGRSLMSFELTGSSEPIVTTAACRPDRPGVCLLGGKLRWLEAEGFSVWMTGFGAMCMQAHGDQ